MQSFTYRYPVTVYFGEGAASANLPTELSRVGQNVLLAYGRESAKKNGILAEMRAILLEAGKTVTEFSGIMPNPTYAKVQEGAKLARENNIDFILAVGGGSVMDCCKAVSAQARLATDLWEFEYTQGKMPTEFIPMGAVVTAFGTGAEMNSGAVITNESKKLKSSLRGAGYSFAVLDPRYTMTMPMTQVVSGAFDSLSHCIESYLGLPDEDNLTDDINEACQRNIIRNLRATLENPQDYKARSELVWDAAIAENGLLIIGKDNAFQAHMLEHQLGAYTNCNHGRGLAAIYPTLLKHMLPEAKEKFAHLAVRVWGVNEVGKSQEELAADFLNKLSEFIKVAGLPTSLTELGISDNINLRAIADSTILVSGCTKKFTRDELLNVLTECV